MTEDHPDRTVTAEELGQWLACTSYSVTELARRGVIERSGRGRYPLKASIRSYAEYMRRVVIQRGEGTAAAERARLARAQAELAEAKMKRLRGELLEADDVQHTWCSMLTATRARLLAVPARLAQTSPHLSRHDLDALDREIRDALTELADEANHDEAENTHP